MRNPRIYLNQALAVNTQVQLSDDAFGHVVRVLRLGEGDAITLFNGLPKDQASAGTAQQQYAQHQARLVNVGKKQAFAEIESEQMVYNESPLNIHLGQGISRGDRMDFTLQKSVELGVQTITPLFTERCGVKLTVDRLKKKQEQWQKIVISACEQSGRCLVPEVKAPVNLSEWQASKRMP